MCRTRERYVLCDASKFSKLSCVSFGNFTDATIITTELDEDSGYRKYEHIIEVK